MQGVLSKVLCLDGKALENLAFCFQIHFNVWVAKGLASYCKAETTFTFYFTILPSSRAFLSIDNREMKSESGFSFVMASQPLEKGLRVVFIQCNPS